jgi:hypothetical protein
MYDEEKQKQKNQTNKQTKKPKKKPQNKNKKQNQKKKKKTQPKTNSDRENKICWVAAILVGRSKRGNKQYSNLGLITGEGLPSFARLLL